MNYRSKAEQVALIAWNDDMPAEKIHAAIERALRETAAEALRSEAESFAAMGAHQMGCIHIAGGLYHRAQRILAGGE